MIIIKHDRYSYTTVHFIASDASDTVEEALYCNYPVGDNRGNDNWGIGPSRRSIEDSTFRYAVLSGKTITASE